MAKKKRNMNDEIDKDWSLINLMNHHLQIYGFTSLIDNIIACCESNISRWEERLGKAKKMRNILGDNWGQN